MALSLDQARQCVLREVKLAMKPQLVPLDEADGYVLAEEIPADRDYPPFDRSARDGFAIRAMDLPGELRILGQVRAGEAFSGVVGPGEAVEIMTGAPLPEGADAVVMVEYTERQGSRVRIEREAKRGDNFSARGSEATEGAAVLRPGHRIGFAEAALLVSLGRASVTVYQRWV